MRCCLFSVVRAIEAEIYAKIVRIIKIIRIYQVLIYLRSMYLNQKQYQLHSFPPYLAVSHRSRKIPRGHVSNRTRFLESKYTSGACSQLIVYISI